MKTIKDLREPVNLYNSKSWILSTVTRYDIEQFDFSDEIKKKLDKIKLTDAEIGSIVNDMGNNDAFMEQYWMTLEATVEAFIESRIREEIDVNRIYNEIVKGA